MKIQSFLIILVTVFLSFSCGTKSGDGQLPRMEFINHEAEKKLDVLVDGKLFTSFCWPDNVYKPILYPVITSGGTEITRGFPLNPREGERNDHIHQVGIWLNYGNVNGIDFWGNGYRGIKEPNGGVIKHLNIERLESRNGEGSFVSAEEWLSPAGKKVLTEKTEYHFMAKGPTRIIDRITTLKAGDSTVLFKDTKEGMFGIRVARQLELPSKEGVILLDSLGNPSLEKDTLNSGVTGNYSSSEGISGDAVWGTRNDWVLLSGVKDNTQVTFGIFDNPKNPGYPAYAHARGYGLFAVNNLGQNSYDPKQEKKSLTIEKGQSITLYHRFYVQSGSELTTENANKIFKEFSKAY